jgi:hypothetical protein
MTHIEATAAPPPSLPLAAHEDMVRHCKDARGGEDTGGEAKATLLLHRHTWRGGTHRGGQGHKSEEEEEAKAASPRRRRPLPVGIEGWRRRPRSRREGAENGSHVSVIYLCVVRVLQRRMDVACECYVGDNFCCYSSLQRPHFRI